MDSKTGGTIVTAGTSKDDGVTCYNSGQDGNISPNCTNRNLMKKLLEQALVGKDAQKVKSGCPPQDKKKRGVPAGRKESGWLAEKNEAIQETDSEVESELEIL